MKFNKKHQLNASLLSRFIMPIVMVILFILPMATLLYAQPMFKVLEESKSFWDDIIRTEHMNSKNLLYAGYVAYKNGITELSIKALRESKVRNPNNNMVHVLADYYIGKCQIIENDYVNAIASFKSAMQRSLDRHENIKHAIKINTAIVHYRKKEYDRFVTLLREVIKEDDLGKYGDIARKMLSNTLAQPSSEYDDEYDDEYEDDEKDDDRRESARSTEPGISKKNSYNIFGVEVGKNMIKSDLGSEYNDPIYYKLFLYHNMLSFIGVSINYEIFSTAVSDSAVDEYPALEDASLKMWGVTGEIHLYVTFARYFKISSSVGIGGASTTYTRTLPEDTVSEGKDPYGTASLALSIEIGSVQIRGGASYKRIFVYNNSQNDYIGNDMYFYSFFGGAGFKL